MKNLSILFKLLIISEFFSACVYDQAVIPTDCTNTHWTHHMTGSGQESWVDLCTGYSSCAGMNQSPVNITSAIANTSLTALQFNYTHTPVEIENNGHTIEFVCENGSKLLIAGTTYELLQFHYHGTSEHQVDGKKYPLEVHFVHKATDTEFAVVGVFFEEGSEHSLFAEYLSHFPKEEGTYTATSEIELADLLPANKSYFHYTGSLTTPPCSEVVKWYVLKQKITASASQLAQFQTILKNNFRNVQSLEGRRIFQFDE